MKKNNQESFGNDDYSRFAGPEYTDQLQNPQRSDGRVYEDICEAFANNTHIEVEDIEIEVSKGIVTLRGRVPSREMKKEAESCLEEILGIRDIFNLITLNEFYDQGSEGLVKHQSRLV